MPNFKLLFLTILLLNFGVLFSQGEADNWYFGNNAGLNFSSGTPTALLDGQLNTTEGCATISNNNGDLLFYTDGITVWNKQHNVMINGSGLQGDPSSSQSGIIVPNPANEFQYYIFSVNDNADNGGVYFSLVDMSLSNGDGEVIPTQKNINLLKKSAEKIAAIDDDNDGFWVIAYASESGLDLTYNTFHAFPITSTGVGSAIKSTYTACETNDGRGYLKISPDGSKLALCNQNQLHVCLHDFDKTNGTVAPEVVINTNDTPYCAEFSPSSEVMYVSTGEYTSSTSYLQQFNLTAIDIPGSIQTIFSYEGQRAGLQLAIDGKIYFARPFESFLGVINNPETIGIGCDYVDEGVNLNGRFSQQGLPPFIQSFFIVDIGVQNTCFGDTTVFSVTSDDPITSILWDFGDGTTSDIENPTHTYATIGTYTITVTVNSAADTKTLTREITIHEVPTAYPVTNYIICDDNSNNETEVFNLSTKNSEVIGTQVGGYAVSYFETFEDAQNNENQLDNTNYQNTSNPQEIFARIYNIQNSSCYDITSFNLIIDEQPTAYNIPDFNLCDDSANDGIETFDLTLNYDNILNGQDSNTYSISFYSSQDDAIARVNQLPDNYQNTSQTETLYYRIENSNNNSCFDVNSFQIMLYNQPTAYTADDIFVCDDPDNDGVDTFDLTLQNAQIINGQSNVTVTYYESEIDAINATNEVNTTNYTNTNNPQELFARVENNNNSACFDISSFSIYVYPNPEIETEETWYICTGETVTLTADAGFDAYLWSTGQVMQSIIVDEAGTYTVTVSSYYPADPTIICTTTKTIHVVESDEAVFDSIEIGDWTATQNTITVLVSGIGNYEYSLDNVVFQDSNTFDGLEPGSYTVYVRDKNGCGIINDDVYLLYYPKYFTPNGDGYHEYWQVIASRSEPNLEIYIFDRYGKVITKVDPLSQGWDGRYNGNELPSTDYWFVVIRPNNGKQYRGHFSLKR